MASYNILCLFTLVSFLSFTPIESWDDPFYLYQYCSSNRTTANTSFQFDLTTLLSHLSSNATGNTQFYNTTFTGNNPSDTIYGMFMCRGDVPSQLCQQCVVNATQRLSSECSLSKEGVIWYDECMVWYSTSYFYSTLTTTPNFDLLNTAEVSNPASFMRLLFSTMNETADEAARSHKKFATREVTVSGFESLYCLAQCTPDLSPHDCRACLSEATRDIPSCCEGRLGGRLLYPSCNIRYEMYPFYLVSPAPGAAPKLVPAANTSHADSEFSEDPVYLSHNCSSNKTFTASNSTFQIHLTTLLSYLSSNATSGNKFHKDDVNNTDTVLYGLFMCRGDVPSRLCGQCVLNASRRISSDQCRSSQEAIIWYSHCMLRYSYRNFFSIVNKRPIYSELNITNTSSNGASQEGNLFTFALANTLSKMSIEAGDSDERYGTKSLKLNDLQALYTLGQCTQDLSSDDCKGCLGDVIGTAIPWSHLGSLGGRVMNPSCNLRFESFQFYRDEDKASRPSSPPSGEVYMFSKEFGSCRVLQKL